MENDLLFESEIKELESRWNLVKEQRKLNLVSQDKFEDYMLALIGAIKLRQDRLQQIIDKMPKECIETKNIGDKREKWKNQ